MKKKKGRVEKKEKACDRFSLSNKSGENANGELRGKEKPCKSREGSRQKKKKISGSSEKKRAKKSCVHVCLCVSLVFSVAVSM